MLITFLALAAIAFLFVGIVLRNKIGGVLIMISSLCAISALVIVVNDRNGDDAGFYTVAAIGGVLMLYAWIKPSRKEAEARLAADRVSSERAPSPWPPGSSPVPPYRASTTHRPSRPE